MTRKKLSEESELKIVKPNLIEVIKFLDCNRLATLFKVYLQGCHEKRPMDIYAWVFKLYGCFGVWQFEAN